MLRVTATPSNLEKLEWLIQQMFKVILCLFILMAQNIENEDLDLKALQPMGLFDANSLLPIIARLSNTYLEVAEQTANEVISSCFM